jgi:LysR family transcriptional activator of nhaA
MVALNLHHLRLFRAVARDRALTGAAQRRNTSPSAVSAQNRARERALGPDLSERSCAVAIARHFPNPPLGEGLR